MSQRERRSNPYPWTWEPAAAVVATLVLVSTAGLQGGRTLANGLATGHWQVASADRWITTAWGLLGGDAAVGLEPPPDVVVASGVLWAVTGPVELALLAATASALRWAWRRWNPFRPLGFADAADVDRTLGLPRLRQSAPLIRPDLHDQGRTTTKPRS